MDLPSKASQRTQARRLVAGLSHEARVAASVEICRRIEEMPEWSAAHTIGIYAAQSSEPDLSGLLADSGKRFCFPRVSGDEMAFHQCQTMDFLKLGPWKLLEPDPALCPVIPAPEIDLILIPGMAFTRGGGRLGRGGGFYDRFLTGVKPHAIKVGVCFQVQLVDALPLEAHDHEVDRVVTEEQLVHAR
jgi:5-formyltetrahydrofolate cyclo-ligase